MLMRIFGYKPLGLALLCLCMSACSIIRLDMRFPNNGDLDSTIISQDEDKYPDVDMLALDDEIIAYLDANVSTQGSDREIVERLQQLLFDPEYLNIQYDEVKTRTAIEAFNDREGNCLSVVSLYIAMARHFGLDAQFQTVKVRPRWDLRGELLVISEHINAVGRFGQSTYYVVDFTPEITVQQLTSSTISDLESRALYFNNLGVESLILEDFDKSLGFFKNALWIDPTLSIAWNNIGTAYSRAGEKELAEYAYMKAYFIDNTNAIAINNLVKYYYNIGDYERSNRYAKAVQRFNNKNPYYHYTMGNVAYSEADYELAKSHYLNAIRRKEVEPVFYLALSKTYEQLGDERAAVKMYDMARLMVFASDEIYLPSQNKVRFIDEKSILRSTSAGISVNTDR